jgi:hypothetical protein
LYVFELRYDTYVSKLTLSVDGEVVARAKRYARNRGTSLSRLVEQYLAMLSGPPGGREEPVTPVLRQLRDDLKGLRLDRSDYYRYLERKYR